MLAGSGKRSVAEAEAWHGQRTMIKAIVGDAADRCARGGNSLWPMPSGVTAATRQASPVARGGRS
jgi:hypothetical protein